MWARALFGRGALPLFPCRRDGPSVLTHNTGSSGCRKLIGKRGVSFCHFGHFSSPRAWNRPCAPREQNEALVQRCVDHLPILADFTFDFSSRSEVWQHFANFVNISPEKEISGESVQTFAPSVQTFAPTGYFVENVGEVLPCLAPRRKIKRGFCRTGR